MEKVSTNNSKLHATLLYIKQHWQLYAIFILPAFLLTIIFRYIPDRVNSLRNGGAIPLLELKK